MNDIRFETDTREVLLMLNYFKNGDWVRAETNALRKASRELVKYNKKRMVSMIPSANRSNPKYKDKLVDAVRQSKVKKKPNEISVKVHTMGTLKTGSGTFRARFFNNSTLTERHTKPFIDSLGRHYNSGRSTGVLKLIHFFDEDPDLATYNIDSEIKLAIEKINNKKYSK